MPEPTAYPSNPIREISAKIAQGNALLASLAAKPPELSDSKKFEIEEEQKKQGLLETNVQSSETENERKVAIAELDLHKVKADKIWNEYDLLANKHRVIDGLIESLNGLTKLVADFK